MYVLDEKENYDIIENDIVKVKLNNILKKEFNENTRK